MKKTSEEREILYKGRYYLFRYLCRQKGIAPKGTKGRWKNLLKEFDNAIARTSPNGWEKGKPITDENVDGLSKYFDIDPMTWNKVKPSYFDVVTNDQGKVIKAIPNMKIAGDFKDVNKYFDTIYENVYFFTHLGKYKFKDLSNYEEKRKDIENILHKIIYEEVPKMLGYEYHGFSRFKDELSYLDKFDDGHVQNDFFDMIEEFIKHGSILGNKQRKDQSLYQYDSSYFERNDKLQIENNLNQKENDITYMELIFRNYLEYLKSQDCVTIEGDLYERNFNIKVEGYKGCDMENVMNISDGLQRGEKEYKKILKEIDNYKEICQELSKIYANGEKLKWVQDTLTKAFEVNISKNETDK